jgi:hypothetical protein
VEPVVTEPVNNDGELAGLYRWTFHTPFSNQTYAPRFAPAPKLLGRPSIDAGHTELMHFDTGIAAIAGTDGSGWSVVVVGGSVVVVGGSVMVVVVAGVVVAGAVVVVGPTSIGAELITGERRPSVNTA